jgi:TonB family protein
MRLPAAILGAALAALLPDAAAGQLLPPGTPPNLDRRVFVDVRDVAPGVVLDRLCDRIACTLSVDPRLPQNDISLKLSNVRARTALDAVCDIVGCRWSLKGTVLSVVATSPPPAVPDAEKWLERMKSPLSDPSWRLQRVPLREVLARLSRHMDTEIVWEGADLDAPVSEDLTGRNAFSALIRLQWALGYQEAATSMSMSFTGGQKIIIGGRGQSASPPEPAPERSRVHDSHEPGLTLPKVVSEARPHYTATAMRAKIEGTVILSAVVEKDGTVGDVKVLKALDPGLDEEATRAAKQWRFEPGRKDGTPVPVIVTLELTFTLRKDGEV